MECPDEIPGVIFGDPRQVNYERTVVTSDFFGPELPEGRIVIQHNCWFRPVKTPVKVHLALARIAGYRDAVYGLPDEIFPVLFEHPDNPDILISTTRLTSYIEGRFCPQEDWKIILGRIFAWQQGDSGIAEIDWKMSVRPTYEINDFLPADAKINAFSRCVKWFNDNMFFRHATGIGVFEGYNSHIEPTGKQSLRPKNRGDCTGEAAMIPALNWAIKRDYASRNTGIKILKNLFTSPELADNCPESPTFGGVNFYEYINAFYGDDNCRAFMGAILSSELMDNYDYAEPILRGMLMILRSCGRNGFRRGRLDNPESFEDGKSWLDYQHEDFVQYSPHRQAYMWAGFLQAYALTGHQEFYDKAENAIRMTMQVFPRLEWTNGITQEYARLILPLAFLVELKDTEEHRNWLRIVSEKLLQNMVECGAIREMMGYSEDGQYPAPKSNAEYGTTEASLIQNNGDPACDLVYTVNYAFIGLYEASIATNDAYYYNAVSKMADFLCRIQVCSDDQHYLDGCWMRGFDYKLWDFFGSSADNGWGAWCVESGWTNSWIGGTIGLMLLGRGLLCRDSAAKYKKKFPDILSQMMDKNVKIELRVTKASAVAPGAE